jgi:hypothetical protein
LSKFRGGKEETHSNLHDSKAAKVLSIVSVSPSIKATDPRRFIDDGEKVGPLLDEETFMATAVKFSQPLNTSLRRHVQRRGTVFLVNLACFGLETMLILKIIRVSPIIDF